MVAGGALPAEHRANYQTPGAESGDAYDLLERALPGPQGRLGQARLRRRHRRPRRPGRGRPASSPQASDAAPRHRREQPLFAPRARSQIAANRQVAYAEVYFDETFDKLINSDAKFQDHFLEAVDHGQLENPALEVEVTTFVAEQELGSEFIGLIFAAFVLLLAFGSALAMGLPILTALFGLGIGATLGGIASRFVETPEWAATVATMIGLGVGIDYALFIITRYRQGAGHGPVAPGGQPHRHGHRRPGRALRRRHGRDLAAGHAHHGPQLPQRRGRLGRAGGAGHAGRLPHPAARHPRVRGPEHRQAQGAVHRPDRRTRAPTPSGTGGAGWCSAGRGSPSPAAPWCC